MLGISAKVPWEIQGVFFYDGYVYADKTFYMNGKAAWQGSTLCTTDYELTRTMKGSFNPITLNIGAIEDYHFPPAFHH